MQRKDAATPGTGTTTSATSQDSRRQKKKAKKQKKSEKQDEANSKKEKQKKAKPKRRTTRRHRNKKSLEATKPTTTQPPPPPPSTPPAAPPSPPSAKPCQTQDEQMPSRRPVAKPVVKNERREREKVSLNNFLSKPIPSDNVIKHIPIGAEIETEKMQYKVIRKLGAGGCGETFVVLNLKTNKEVCAKVEFLPKEDQRLRQEFRIYLQIHKIKRRNKLALPHLLRCYDYGEDPGVVHFLFLPLCQNSLEGYMKNGSPSLSTAFELSIQILEGIQELHSLGIIHRDLKPANVVINAELTKAYIIDFGMSCPFITDIAKMPESSLYDFIGTTKYAPREAHKSLPQSRKSDLEAWIYVILELFVPDIIPWRDCTNIKEVEKMKDLFFTTCYARRIAQAPKCFSEILPIIESTSNVGAPDYEKCFGLIRKDAENRKLKLKQKFKLDSTLLDLEIELWKTGELSLPSREMDKPNRLSADELKMDSEKSANRTPSKLSSLCSVTPSRSTTTETPQREPDEHALLHSQMKCRVVQPSNGQSAGAAGSDDDSERAKEIAQQNGL